MGFHADILQQDHLVIILGLLEDALEIEPGIAVIASEKLLIGTHDTFRCLKQPLPVRIVSGPLDQGADSRFRVFPGGARSDDLDIDIVARGSLRAQCVVIRRHSEFLLGQGRMNCDGVTPSVFPMGARFAHPLSLAVRPLPAGPARNWAPKQ